MSYGWLGYSSVWHTSTAVISYGRLNKPSVWQDKSTPMPYGVSKLSLWDSKSIYTFMSYVAKSFVWLIKVVAPHNCSLYVYTNWWMTWKRFTQYCLVLCGRNLPVVGGYISQRANNMELLGFLGCQAARVKLNIALRSQVWVTSFGYGQVLMQLYFQRSLLCWSWRRLASSKKQPMLTSGLTYICFVIARLSVIKLESNQHQNVFIDVQNIIWRTQIKSTDIHVGLKLEWNLYDKYLWSWNCTRFFFRHPFDGPLGIIYANILRPLSDHSSMHFSCPVYPYRTTEVHTWVVC